MSDEPRDVVVGVCGGYEWDHVKHWVNSLNRSGFTGDKVMIVYSGTKQFLDKLRQEGIAIFAFAMDPEGNCGFPRKRFYAVVIERFYDLWSMMNQFDARGQSYRYIITTDVRDVVFQRNPSEWLEKNMDGCVLNVGSECIRYEHETWGADNMMRSFGPEIFDMMKSKIIYNAGTLAGDWKQCRDFFLTTYLMSQYNPIYNPDQAALNILLNTHPWQDCTRFSYMADGWCCNLGTVGDPNKRPNYLPNLVEQEPPVFDNGFLLPKVGAEPFVLVHQYDRVPQLREMIEAKYV